MQKIKLEEVFKSIRQGRSLYAACMKAGLPTGDFYQTLAKNPKAQEEFKLALADYADQCTDEIKNLAAALKAGEIDTSTAKLLIETSKWLALKASPEPFAAEVEEGNDLAEIVVKFV